MNTNDEDHKQDPLDANLAKLIRKDSLPPAPSPTEKAAMMNSLRKKQAELTQAVGEPSKIIRFPVSLAAVAAVVGLLAALIGVLIMLSPDPVEVASDPQPKSDESAVGDRTPAATPVKSIDVPDPEPVAVQGPVDYEAPDGARRISLRDGSTAIAQKGTRFTEVEARKLKLEVGSLYMLVAKADTPLEVITPQGKALALGTRFLVSTKANDTRVAVAQGTVRLLGQKAEKPIDLARGEEGIVEADEWIKRPAPRLSHLLGWARKSLRQPELIEIVPFGQNGLIAIDPNGQESRLSLRKYMVDVFIENGVARTTIDQTFFNHYHANTEGTFYFPLPPGAAVSRMAMYVNGVRNEAGMVERQRGQQIYNDIKYANRDPALLEQLQGNLYKLRIFPLEGRQEKRIFISFTQTVDELYRTLRYWLPMDHTQANAGQVKIDVRIRHGQELYEAKSDTHQFTTKIDKGDLVLSYEAENIKPDQDLLLKLIPKVKLQEIAEVSALNRGGRNYLHTRIRPELAGKVDVQPRQWFVLNDVSASRSKVDLQGQAHILERLLVEGDDQDQIAIANLNIDTDKLTNGLVSLRGRPAKEAVQQMRESQRLGGTNFAAGIAAMRAWITKTGAKNPYLIYLGDGLATDGGKSIAELTTLLDKEVPFVGIAVGKKADLTFLREAANVTGGVALVMNPDEDLNWRVFDMLASFNTPRLQNISWEFDKGEGVTAYTDRATLLAGEALTLVAATSKELPTEVTLRGKLNGEAWEKTISLADPREDAGFIPRFWAQRHLEELLKEGEKNRDEIVRLSMKHYVATPFTSLLVLENEQMYQKYKVEKGRKDHWAAYSAPDKIPVVREPVAWYAYHGYNPAQSGDDSKVSLDPKSAPEILNTLLPTPRIAPVPMVDANQLRGLYGRERDGWRWNGDQTTPQILNTTIYDDFYSIEPGFLGIGQEFGGGLNPGGDKFANSINGNQFYPLYSSPDTGLVSFLPINPNGGFLSPALDLSDDLLVAGKPNMAQSDLARAQGLSYRLQFGGAPQLHAAWISPNNSLPGTRLFGGHYDYYRSKGWGGAQVQANLQIGTLIRSLPALATSGADRASAVEMKLGREPRGAVTDEAAALVKAAEARRKPVRIHGVITTPDGKTKSTRTSPMYLKEEVISDGKFWYHIYGELGLATRRPVTPTNLAAIQAAVPHWPPSLNEFKARWKVTLKAKGESWFEILVTNPESADENRVLRISNDGRLLQSRQFQAGKLLHSLQLSYEGNEVVIESKSGLTERYEAVEVEVADALFAPELKELVVLDLPLRKPAYYQKQLAAVDAKDVEKKKQVLRHLITSRLRDVRPQAAQGKVLASKEWAQLIQLGAGKSPVYDYRTLSVALNPGSAEPEQSDFLAHLKDVLELAVLPSPPRERLEEFMKDWPASPYLLTLVQRCQEHKIWIGMLDVPRHRGVAAQQIAQMARSQSWPEADELAKRVAAFLVADAQKAKPSSITHEIAGLLGRGLQGGDGEWKMVVDAYESAATKIATLELRHVAALLDLALLEKKDDLENRCLAQIRKTIKVADNPQDIVALAAKFAHYERHEQATEFYREALGRMDDPSATLLEHAASAASYVDEKQSIDWQLQALRKLGEDRRVVNQQQLAHNYSGLIVRAIKLGDRKLASEIALEGYELLSAQHSLITLMAAHFHAEGDETERWRWISTILDRNPKNADASGAIGTWYEQKEMMIEAAEMFDDAHSFDSAHPQWLIKGATALYSAGKFAEGDKRYAELIKTKWAHQLKPLVPKEIHLYLTARHMLGTVSPEKPGENWKELDFDDSDWEERVVRFQSADVNLPLWDKPFYVRHKFDIEHLPRRVNLQADVHGAEVEVYLNGTLLQRLVESRGGTKGPGKNFTMKLTKGQMDLLRNGENILAFKCKKLTKNPRVRMNLIQVFDLQD